MSITKRIILITGLTGYLAGRTAEAALKEGFRVRGTTRNLAAGIKVKEALCKLGYNAEDIEVVEVPNISKPGAFDEAVVGCTAIFHLAYPIGDIWTMSPAEVMRIGEDGASTMLESALKAGAQLQTVAYMSSVAAVFNTPAEDRTHSEKDWNTTSEGLIEKLGAGAGGFNAYLASKTVAEKVFWKFREERRPSFAVTALQPSYFIGVPLIPWETNEQITFSNKGFWQVVSGQPVPGPMMMYEDTIDIRDIARILVWTAQNPREADGERFICSSHVGGGQAIADIVDRRLRSLKIQKGEPGCGYRPDYTLRGDVIGFDGSKAVKATGREYIPYEDSVVDMATFLQRYL